TKSRRSSGAPPEAGSGWSSPRLLLPRRRLACRGPCSGKSDDRTRGAFLHAVHDPLIHAQHELVEVFLRRDSALISGLCLDLLEHRVQLLLHLGSRVLPALDPLLSLATEFPPLLEQCHRFTVIVQRFARPLERLVFGALPNQAAYVLCLLFQHRVSRHA